MPSLRRQLGRNMLLTLSLALAALLLLVDMGVRTLIDDYIRARLAHDADGIIAALQKNPDGQWQLDSKRLPAIYQRVKSGHYYRARIGATDIRSRSLWDADPALPSLPSGAQHSDIRPGFDHERWLTWAQAVTKDGDLLLVWVAEDISDVQKTLRIYRLWAGAMVLLSISLLMLAQHWILKRGFRQLDQVRDAIKALHAGDNTGFNPAMPQEVQPLVQEIGRLLQRLQQRVSRSRNALGNLAHEMKRPLQRLRLLSAELPAGQLQELDQALDNITHLVERELKRARIVGLSSPGRQTVIANELPVLVELLQKIHPRCTVHAEFPPALVLPQDRDDMLELFGNLLDNACKYGNGRVQLRLTETADHWQIEVDDNGPGIPPPLQQQMLERGTRLDESKTGAGLGLSICHDIVRSYDGSLAFATPAEGGFRVQVRLPKNPAH